MNISNINFNGIYKIKCKDLNQAKKIKESLPDTLDFNQTGKDIVIMSYPHNDKSGKVLDLLKENTDIHDKNLHNAAINAYRKTSQMAPGRIVDTYR